MHDADTLCTRFVPKPKPISGVKKWIAHSEGFAKGEITVNNKALEALRGDKAVSILPIGIVGVSGDFEKDDIIRVLDGEGNLIGLGKANCSSAQAQASMGKHAGRAVVHYDYLYME